MRMNKYNDYFLKKDDIGDVYMDRSFCDECEERCSLKKECKEGKIKCSLFMSEYYYDDTEEKIKEFLKT